MGYGAMRFRRGEDIAIEASAPGAVVTDVAARLSRIEPCFPKIAADFTITPGNSAGSFTLSIGRLVTSAFLAGTYAFNFAFTFEGAREITEAQLVEIEDTTTL